MEEEKLLFLLPKYIYENQYVLDGRKKFIRKLKNILEDLTF